MKILHPTDFSTCAEKAQSLALQLAHALGAELILLHVAVETPPFALIRVRELEQLFEEQREWAQQTLEEQAAEWRGKGIPTRACVVSGAPHDKIVEAAKQEGAAFIVMGTYGRGVVERFLLGSVADRVVRTAPCAVVTTRERAGVGETASASAAAAAPKAGS
jgi:nucleotide-binding universal stress UspA family protein